MCERERERDAHYDKSGISITYTPCPAINELTGELRKVVGGSGEFCCIR